MRALLQRVSQAQVTVDQEIIGKIGSGWLILLGIHKDDQQNDAIKLIDKILGLRLFSDDTGKFNHSVVDISGEVLVVSQFTLYADTSRGRRPGFSDAAPPHHAKELYEFVVNKIKAQGLKVSTGQFAAHMKVSLENDGPVTVMLDTKDF